MFALGFFLAVALAVGVALSRRRGTVERRKLEQRAVSLEAASQSAALADYQAQLTLVRAQLAEARDEIARLNNALTSLRREQEARLQTLPMTAEREENALLRQTLKEIGAAIIQAAAGAAKPDRSHEPGSTPATAEPAAPVQATSK